MWKNGYVDYLFIWMLGDLLGVVRYAFAAIRYVSRYATDDMIRIAIRFASYNSLYISMKYLRY